MRQFEVVSPFKPAGDQGQAIASLASGIKADNQFQVLQGVTGSGKTFTMAKIIEAVQMLMGHLLLPVRELTTAKKHCVDFTSRGE